KLPGPAGRTGVARFCSERSISSGILAFIDFGGGGKASDWGECEAGELLNFEFFARKDLEEDDAKEVGLVVLGAAGGAGAAGVFLEQLVSNEAGGGGDFGGVGRVAGDAEGLGLAVGTETANRHYDAFAVVGIVMDGEVAVPVTVAAGADLGAVFGPGVAT